MDPKQPIVIATGNPHKVEELRAILGDSALYWIARLFSDHLSEQEETRLFEHYGIAYTDEGSTTAQEQSHGGDAAAGGRLRRYVAGENQHDVVGSVRTNKRTSAG